jgi:hypothetical protein
VVEDWLRDANMVGGQFNQRHFAFIHARPYVFCRTRNHGL